MQTTAMSEVATVLGGYENVEQAVLNIHKRTKPEIIGICSTGVTETKATTWRAISSHPREASGGRRPAHGLCLHPGLQGRFQDGWEKTVTRMVEVLVEVPDPASANAKRLNVLPGTTSRPAILDELRTIIEGFRPHPLLPAGSRRLAGRAYSTNSPPPPSADRRGRDRRMARRAGRDRHRRADAPGGGGHGKEDRRCPSPVRAAVRVEANDEFIMFLSQISGRPGAAQVSPPAGQLVDACWTPISTSAAAGSPSAPSRTCCSTCRPCCTRWART